MESLYLQTLQTTKFNKMKKVLIALFAISSLATTAQTESKGAFLNLNVGTRVGGNAIAPAYNLDAAGLHLEGGLGYMFNSQIGIKGDIALDQFNATLIANENVTASTSMYRGSLQLVWNFAETAGFATDKFAFNFHTGAGITSIANKEYRALDMEFTSKGIKANDDAYNAIVGLNPQFAINEKLAFNIDLSYVMLFDQNKTIDYTERNEGMASYTTAAIGLTFKF